MTLHVDLLRQAHQLAVKEPKHPLQASLRRAVSTAYYALFHLLVYEATNMISPGPQRAGIRACLTRAFAHSTMKKVADQFAKGNISDKLIPGFEKRESLKVELTGFAETFSQLQDARHEADYDLRRNFTRAEVLDLIGRAETAFEQWAKVRGNLQADTFLVGILSFQNMKL